MCGTGCGIVTYPDSFAAPDFEVYRLTTDAFPEWWRCSYERRGTICEASITKQVNGDYLLEIAVSGNDEFGYNELSAEIVAELLEQQGDRFDLIPMPPRILTAQEVDRMKNLFAELHINRDPPPFTLVCCRGIRLLQIHEWDDVRLGTHTYATSLIDYMDSAAIYGFLREFLPSEYSQP